jgi:hypothetical protein
MKQEYIKMADIKTQEPQVTEEQQTELQKFNDAVIKKMEESRNPETGRIEIVGVDLSSPDIAVTQLNFSDTPGLVIVKLTPDPEGKMELTERIDQIGLILTFSDIASVQKVIQWCSLIYDRLYVDGLSKNTSLKDLV